MQAVLHTLAIYLLIMLVLRLTGKRTLAQVTVFDLVLVLVISEATQQALLGQDFSLTAAALVVITLVLLERATDYLAWRSPRARRWLESSPTVLIADGQVDRGALRQYLLTEEDVLAAARQQSGVASLEQIRWAALESSGTISVVPYGADPGG